jgi:processive 1,2-diacylglycerol beta-glucosyltransferase
MKILLTSVSAGSGHVRAAEAVQAALWRSRPGVEAVHVDVMNFVTPGFRRLYTGGYNLAVNRAPALWGHFYNFWDRRPPEGEITSSLRRLQRRAASSFFRYLSNVQPDLIITTHFLVPQLLGENHSYPWLHRIPLECVITDYDLHQFWISENISRYYVAHEDLAAKMVKQGISPSRIVVSGIPVHPVFLTPVSEADVCRRLNLDPVKPTILVLAGGLGLSTLERTVRSLFRLDFPVQLLTVAGRNDRLRRRLDQLVVPPHITLVNQGYVRNMEELLSISRLVITKPGGLTVSECMAKQKPMILCNPIPGQEEHNASYLLQHGLAMKVKDPIELPLLVDQFFRDPDLRSSFQKNLASLSRPRAAFDIAETASQVLIAAA